MSPSLDKVSPTHHSEYGMGGWENEKWCEGSTRAAQRCSLRGKAKALRAPATWTAATLDLVLRLKR